MPTGPERAPVELAAPGPHETLTAEELLAVEASPSRRIIRIGFRLDNGADLRTALDELLAPGPSNQSIIASNWFQSPRDGCSLQNWSNFPLLRASSRLRYLPLATTNPVQSSNFSPDPFPTSLYTPPFIEMAMRKSIKILCAWSRLFVF